MNEERRSPPCDFRRLRASAFTLRFQRDRRVTIPVLRRPDSWLRPLGILKVCHWVKVAPAGGGAWLTNGSHGRAHYWEHLVLSPGWGGGGSSCEFSLSDRLVLFEKVNAGWVTDSEVQIGARSGLLLCAWRTHFNWLDVRTFVVFNARRPSFWWKVAQVATDGSLFQWSVGDPSVFLDRRCPRTLGQPSPVRRPLAAFKLRGKRRVCQRCAHVCSSCAFII